MAQARLLGGEKGQKGTQRENEQQNGREKKI
jgi:hypothetical protein